MRTSARVVATVVFAVVIHALPALAQQRRPNIVVFVADDMGYADLGVHGCRDIPTPNIDALAASGIRFTDAYVSGPYCGPTRAGLLTAGRRCDRARLNTPRDGHHALRLLPV